MMQLDAFKEAPEILAPGGAYETADDNGSVRLWELQHRVRNDLQRLAALAEQHARQTQDVAAQAGFERIARHVAVLGQLYGDLLGRDAGDVVDLARHLETVCAKLAESQSLRERCIQLDLDLASCRMEAEMAVALGLVVTELILNAAEHAFPGQHDGVIAVHLIAGFDGQPGAVLVSDNGVGIADLSAGSHGLTIARALARRVGAALHRELGPGTAWRIAFAGVMPQ